MSKWNTLIRCGSANFLNNYSQTEARCLNAGLRPYNKAKHVRKR